MILPENVEKLFEQVRVLSQNEQKIFFNQTCSKEDDIVRKELDSLLDAFENAESFFTDFSERIQDITLKLDSDISTYDGNDLRRIGPWKIVKLLGRGGMGVVYLATRDDRQYQLKVALKIIPFGLNDPITRYRFNMERQILAQLRHENIARFLDGGVTEQGTPYFVMDYVNGQPINRYCLKYGLTINQRLEIFLRVCSAVEYAHRNMVIHRDIKPANILVNEEGEVKLLDFGIAKIMNDKNFSANITQVCSRPMSRNYSSPEMLLGKKVDVTTDVYSLGVLLYEILTELKLEKSITTDEVKKPSTIVSEKYAKNLREDLDNIILKSIKHNPIERYSSVEHFSEDIRRHLTGHAVHAQPVSMLYNIKKFVSRHLILVSFSCFTAIALIALTSLSINYAVRTEKQSRQVALERERAEAIKNFIIAVFNTTDPNNSQVNISALELIDRGLTKIEVELKNQPKLQFELYQTFGEIFGLLRDDNKSFSAFERASVTAKLVFGKQSHQYTASLIHMAESVENLGDYERSKSLATQALDLSVKREYLDILGWCYQLIGRIQHLQGDYSSAEQYFLKALKFNQDVLGETNPRTANTLIHLGTLYDHMEKYAESEAHLRAALKIRELNQGTNHSNIGEVLLGLAKVLASQEKYSESISIFERADALFNKYFGSNSLYNAYVASGLGNIHLKNNRFARAKVYFKETVRLVKLNTPNSPNLGIVLSYLASTHLKLNEHNKAKLLFTTALIILDKHLPEHWLTSKAHWQLGSCLVAEKNFKSAEAHITGAVAKLIRKKGSKHKATQDAIAAAIELYVTWGKKEREKFYSAKLIPH